MPFDLFSYELMPDNIYSVEDNAVGKGLMSYIIEGVIYVILRLWIYVYVCIQRFVTKG